MEIVLAYNAYPVHLIGSYRKIITYVVWYGRNWQHAAHLMTLAIVSAINITNPDDNARNEWWVGSQHMYMLLLETIELNLQDTAS